MKISTGLFLNNAKIKINKQLANVNNNFNSILLKNL